MRQEVGAYADPSGDRNRAIEVIACAFRRRGKMKGEAVERDTRDSAHGAAGQVEWCSGFERQTLNTKRKRIQAPPIPSSNKVASSTSHLLFRTRSL